MTTNQIRFAELRESQRHNVETERQGVKKLAQDYDVGLRQASAAQSSAAAAHKSGDANLINAATRQAELDWSKYQYEDTGASKVTSETGLNEARTKEAESKAEESSQRGRVYKSQANVAEATEYPQTITIGANAVSAQFKPGLDLMKGMLTIGQLGQ